MKKKGGTIGGSIHNVPIAFANRVSTTFTTAGLGELHDHLASFNE